MPILSTIASRAYGLIAGLSGIADIIVNYFIGTSNSDIYASETGTSFLKRKETFGTTPINTVSYDSTNKFFAAGNSGKAFRSTDGNTWTSVNTGLGANNLRLFTHNGRSFISSSTGNLTTVSTDGVTWTTININHGVFPTSLTTGNPSKSFTVGSDTLLFGNPGSSSYLLTSNSGSDLVTAFNSKGVGAGQVWTTIATFASTTFGVRSIAYGNNTYVSIGGFNSSPNVVWARTSTDGVTWTTRTLNSSLPGQRGWSVTYGNGIFLACFLNFTYSDGLRTSTDGITWVTRSSATTNGLRQVIYGNGMYFGLGSGYNSSSTDGITWTARAGLKQPQCAAYSANAGLWAVGGYRNFVWTSPDLVTWTTRWGAYNSSKTPYAMVYSTNGTLAMVSSSSASHTNGVATSTDGGVNWTQRTTPSMWGQGFNELSLGTNNSGTWLAGTQSQLHISTDNGATWSALLNGNCNIPSFLNNQWWVGMADSTIINSQPASLRYKDISKISSNTIGIIDNSSAHRISTSPGNSDSVRVPMFDNIKSVGAMPTYPYFPVAYGRNKWVALTQTAGVLKTSTDAITWTTVSYGTGTVRSSIAYGNGIFVTTGTYNLIMSSTDAVTWVTRYNAGVSYGAGYDVKYNGSKWVVAGASGVSNEWIIHSTDAITWTRLSLATGNGMSLTDYGNNVWVAVSSNKVWRSTDNAVSWAQQGANYPTAGGMMGLSYGNGFVMSDSDGRVWNSTDGATWVTRSGVATTANQLGRTAFINGLFVGVAQPYFKLMTSTDGATWQTNHSHYANTGINSYYSSIIKHPDQTTAVIIDGYLNGLVFADTNAIKLSHDLSGNITYSKLNNNILLVSNSSVIFRVDSSTGNYKYFQTNISGLTNIYSNSSNTKYIAQTATNYYLSTDLTTWTTITGDPSSSIINQIAIV